jgi:hypothetical protein
MASIQNKCPGIVAAISEGSWFFAFARTLEEFLAREWVGLWPEPWATAARDDTSPVGTLVGFSIQQSTQVSIAAPMIGGVITSGILKLLRYPVIYVFWRERHLGTSLAAKSVAALSSENSTLWAVA